MQRPALFRSRARPAPRALLLPKKSFVSAPRIYLDADACPVKDEAYRVALRHGVPVAVVANSFVRIPADPLIARISVATEPDAADDWIVANAVPGDIVVTSDVPLAHRCVTGGVTVIAPNGREFTPDSIGMALAVRDLLHDLRSAGSTTSGPPPFAPRDRSTFLSALDLAVRRRLKAVS